MRKPRKYDYLSYNPIAELYKAFPGDNGIKEEDIFVDIKDFSELDDYLSRRSLRKRLYAADENTFSAVRPWTATLLP